MTRLAWIPLAALTLAGCGEGEGNGTSFSITAQSDEGNTAIASTENGSVSVKAPGFEGSFKLPKVAIKAEDFDVNGVKLYPGSTVTGFNVSSNNRMGERDKGSVTISFDTPLDAPALREWYAKELARRGFRVEATGDGFAGTTDEGEPFTLHITPREDGTSKGRMMVGA